MIFDMFVIPEQNPRNAVETARFLDDHGFNGAWIGDSPPIGWGDVYATLALCAGATSRIKLRTGVTNPLTRQAMVTANAIITIDRISNGRAQLGIGTGDSAVRALGLKPAKFSVVIDYIAEVRRICADRGNRIPVYLAASGPKALMHAGRVADGAMVSVGTHPSLVRRALEHIAAGAQEAGRKLEDLDVAFMAGLSIADTWEEAKREASALAARRAKDAQYHPEFFFPPDLEHLRAEALAIAEHYNYREHLSADAAHGRLVTDRIVDAYTLAGTSDACATKLEAMRQAGADHIVLFPSGHDRLGAMRRFTHSVMDQFR
ncbi:MAG: LLM class flavin-dependent oxidoreductase [Betaproteobacteria bacterium]|nr:LLM class flavin-dependent oxidoreductase [Betaproteobacteria bacterium]